MVTFAAVGLIYMCLPLFVIAKPKKNAFNEEFMSQFEKEEGYIKESGEKAPV